MISPQIKEQLEQWKSNSLEIIDLKKRNLVKIEVPPYSDEKILSLIAHIEHLYEILEKKDDVLRRFHCVPCDPIDSVNCLACDMKEALTLRPKETL